MTAVTEARQEIADNLVLSPAEFNLVGIVLKWEDLYPAFYGYVLTGIGVHELLANFRRDAYEGYLEAIPFDPSTVLPHIAREKWTAVSALTAIATLQAFYPIHEVEAAARSVPAKGWRGFLDTL